MVRAVQFFMIALLLSACSKPVPYRTEVIDFLIPAPAEITVQKGHATINTYTVIQSEEQTLKEAEYLQQLIGASSTFTPKIVTSFVQEPGVNYIVLQIDSLLQGAEASSEAYKLRTLETKIEIVGKTPQGLMRGIQTLRQLFTNGFYKEKKHDTWYLPLVQISDAPAFKHRGMLFDSGRHFFDINVVKKYIDLLALYKMNVFHWHLTEDQGWRIAIDKYPKLTEIGAFRTEEDGSVYGGFYTKQQIKEVVAYATERHITVIPEIELPGHSQAALAAYPEISCTGEAIEVANKWGVFKDIYCAGNEKTFVFLENVLTEVMALFPSKYIHIGGDEAPKYRWERCKKCQQRIQQENLHDTHELQSYFIKRIEKFLHQNNRQLIGWDEILEGGLSPTATVQSWRGEQGGITAANNKQYAIMSPTSHCYFDYGIATTNLEKVYAFNPIPKTLPKDKHQYILGSECNLWSEYIPDEANLDSKAFPRMLAMTEVLWRAPVERDFTKFYNRVQNHYPFLSANKVLYGLEFVPLSVKSEWKNQQLQVSPVFKTPDFTAKYRWNCEDCDTVFTKFSQPVVLQKTAVLEVAPYKKGKKYGDNTYQAYQLHKAANSSVTYEQQYEQSYAAGGLTALVDGKIGSTHYRDGNWQGFYGKDAVLTIDLGTAKEVQEIGAHFLHRQRSWIFSPTALVIKTSENGTDWEPWAEIPSAINPKTEKNTIETFVKRKPSKTVRYVQVHAKNILTLPAWHDASGATGWIFIDEIFVN